MKFVSIPVTPYQQNCSLVWSESSRQGAVIDPGGDINLILRQIAQHQVQVEKILLTHGHMDHVGGAIELKKALAVPIIGPHKADAFWLQALPEQAKMMGLPPQQPFQPDTWLKDGDSVTVGEDTLEVFHCPGHTPGHVVFFHRPSALAWVGDVLFAGSIGRSDFPMGDHDALVGSIRGKLWPLGDAVRFIPGHGPLSTFGQERLHNPFVADHRFG